jgi:uncharacterized lipoprotein YajG
MHPNREFIGLALPCAGALRRRVILAAGAIAVLSGCALSPSTSGTATPAARATTAKQEELASISPVQTDANRPLTADEVARQNQLVAKLAEPESLLETRLQTDFNSLERQWDSFLIHI